MKRSLTFSLALMLSALAFQPVYAQYYYPNPYRYYPPRPVYPQGYYYRNAYPQYRQYYMPNQYAYSRQAYRQPYVQPQMPRYSSSPVNHAPSTPSTSGYNGPPANQTSTVISSETNVVAPDFHKNADQKAESPFEIVSPDAAELPVDEEQVSNALPVDMSAAGDSTIVPENVTEKECTACKKKAALEEAAVEECAVDDAACKKHKRKCRFLVFGEALYFGVRGVDVPFGQGFDGTTPLAVQRGSIGVADPDYNIAFRAGAGVALSDCSWIQGTYSWYESDTRARLNAPAGTTVRAFLTFPNTMNAAPTSQFATADYAIDYHMADAEYKRIFCQGPCHSLNFLLGARYAHLEQDLLANYEILGTTTVESDINFDGVGPRAGLEGLYRLKCGAFGYGKGIMNLLAGHFSARYEQNNVFTGLQGQTEFGDDRIVPVLEFEAGVGWMSPKGHVRVNAGYYIGTWFNTMTTPGLAQTIQGGTFASNGENFITQGDDLEDTLSFDGLVGRIEFRY